MHPRTVASLLFAILLTGCSGGNSSNTTTTTPPPQAAATPTFAPAPGLFTTGQSVTLADATTGATIYYTTDGTTPTTASSTYTAAIPFTADTTIQAIAVATGYTTSPTAQGLYQIAGPTVYVVQSTNDQTQLMAAQPSTQFTDTTAGTNNITVDETQQYQTIEGFGAAFTDSAAYLLEQVESPSSQASTLSDLFTRNGKGIGLSFMRVPIGATDIARSLYSFDDMPTGQSDPTLANFSIAHDQTYIIPLIQQAKALNPQMKLLATPWSPPGWMKSTGSMNSGTLLPTAYTPFANYLVKYLQAYKTAGIPYDYLTIVNEPLNQTTSYPSMYMDAPTELTVMRDYVLPALTTANLTTKLFVYDHNWDTPAYPETVLADPTLAASPLVAGTAWHGYAGTPGAQQTVQNMFPNLGTWETEHSGGTWQTNQFTTDFMEITQVMRNASKSFVKWSLALDQTLGPNLTELNTGLGGCATCTPIVTINSATGAPTKDIEYYTLGHYSKYVLPGAKRIYSSNNPAIVTAAFINPDASKALIAFNNATTTQTFQIQWGTQSFSYTLPAFAAATFTWTGTQSGTPLTPATSQIQGSSYSQESGLETETTGDTTGGYDLGYVSPGATALYKSINFGASVSTVSVRTASAGDGGTLEFHLDSISGPLIATANLPVTGGWQVWQTVTAPVSGASGIHDLYLVFSGSAAGISNVNWFQFN
ncbi:MAG: carbohydrate-binding protein [Acidobacteriaceae bacterium]